MEENVHSQIDLARKALKFIMHMIYCIAFSPESFLLKKPTLLYFRIRQKQPP